MNEQRAAEIYQVLSDTHVELIDDPRTHGIGYISAKINEIHRAVEILNELFQEVDRDFASARNMVRLLETQQRQMVRKHLLSDDIAELDASQMEKTARAELAWEEEYRVDRLEKWIEEQSKTDPESRPTEDDLPHFPTMADEITQYENEVEIGRALREVIQEKLKELKQADSGVRLQNQSIETELKLYGGAPQEAGQGNGNPNRRRQGRRSTPNSPISEPAFEDLCGDGGMTEPDRETVSTESTNNQDTNEITA